MSPLALRTWSRPILRHHAIRVIGLGIDLEGAAEPVELVDVGRAEIGLERLEDVAQGHPERLGLDPVDRHRQLRRAGAERAHDPLDPGLRAALLGYGLAHVLQLDEVEAVILELDLHLGPGGIADALDRRRHEDEADPLLQLRQLVAQPGVEVAQTLRPAPLAPVLEDHVGGAGFCG
jgi:hypothetical protein